MSWKREKYFNGFSGISLQVIFFNTTQVQYVSFVRSLKQNYKVSCSVTLKSIGLSLDGSFIHLWVFTTSNIDHLGNISPLSYEGLANTDTFNNIIF